MAYGYQQYDSNGDEIVNSSTPVLTIVKYDTITITLYKNAAFGNTTYNYSLPGVTSQADLDDNYIIEEAGGGGFSLFVTNSSYGITFVSNGVIQFNGSGGCSDIFGNPGQCTALDVQTKTYNIYTIGETV